MNLMLTPELETSLLKKAQRLGTTPELLALDVLRRELLAEDRAVAAPAARSLVEYLADHIGVLASKSVTKGETPLSENCGEKFTEGLMRKHRKTSP